VLLETHQSNANTHAYNKYGFKEFQSVPEQHTIFVLLLFITLGMKDCVD